MLKCWGFEAFKLSVAADIFFNTSSNNCEFQLLSMTAVLVPTETAF